MTYVIAETPRQRGVNKICLRVIHIMNYVVLVADVVAVIVVVRLEVNNVSVDLSGPLAAPFTMALFLAMLSLVRPGSGLPIEPQWIS